MIGGMTSTVVTTGQNHAHTIVFIFVVEWDQFLIDQKNPSCGKGPKNAERPKFLKFRSKSVLSNISCNCNSLWIFQNTFS